MRKQDIQKIFKHYDITLKELKECYTHVVREAKKLWKEGCIQEEHSNFGMPRLYAQIGFNLKKGLICRADWHYSYMNGEAAEWYHALQINVLDEGDYTAADSSDWLYEDKHYQRTGQISQRALQECSKAYPLDFKTFEEVAVELAQSLADKM